MRSHLFSIALPILLSAIFLTGAIPAGSCDVGNTAQSSPQSKPAPKPAQSAPPQDQQDQDAPVRLGARLVLVPVSATDAAGQPVKDLKAEEVVIEEEGRPQQVVALGEPGKTPVDIALLFDVSTSTNAQFTFEQQAAVQFIHDVLKPVDSVSLFSIGITPKLVKARTTSSEEIVAGIHSIGPLKEPTAFFDTVVDATEYLDKNADSGSRRVLVVISDGEENYSVRHKLPDALRELQKGDCLFYAINPTGGGIRLNVISTKGQRFMESLAAETGGKAFNLARVEELPAVFSQIAAELQAQYLFGYYATGEATAGFRRISVRAPNRPDLRIRARQGYYVAKP